MIVNCPCCSNLTYDKCYETFHVKQTYPSTPKALMRSRYADYVLNLISYLIETTHVETRHLHKRKDIKNWSMQNHWLKLEIISAFNDNVEFKAFYQFNSKNYLHHENSTFKMENGII